MRLRLLIILILISSCNQFDKDTDTLLTVCFAGDLLLDRGVRQKIEQIGVDKLFIDVEPHLKSTDYAIANLECPATHHDTPLEKEYTFRAEPHWLSQLNKSGFTHLGLANNHSIDRGRKGLLETVNNFNQYNLIPLGAGVNQKDACEPVILKDNNISVAIFSSVLLPLESWEFSVELPGPCQSSIDDIVRNIGIFRQKSSSDIYIVVYMHWGVEYQEFPHKDQYWEARRLIDAGADIIIGHHPHVVQSIDMYKGKHIFYSLGNFLFDQSSLATTRGLLVKLKFSPHRLEQVFLIPVKIDNCQVKLMGKTESALFFENIQIISIRAQLVNLNHYWNLLL